jgi:hypothetical protein
MNKILRGRGSVKVLFQSAKCKLAEKAKKRTRPCGAQVREPVLQKAKTGKQRIKDEG